MNISNGQISGRFSRFVDRQRELAASQTESAHTQPVRFEIPVIEKQFRLHSLDSQRAVCSDFTNSQVLSDDPAKPAQMQSLKIQGNVGPAKLLFDRGGDESGNVTKIR